MKYTLGIVAIFTLVFFNSFTTKINCENSLEHTSVEDTTKKATTTGPMGYKAFLGCSTTIDGGIQDKATILELLKYPLCVRDKNNQSYTVHEFLLTYSERGVYQDSTGLPTIVTDYTTIEIDSNVIPLAVQKSLTERLYKGDTLTFSEIFINRNNSKMLINKPLKVIVQ